MKNAAIVMGLVVLLCLAGCGTSPLGTASIEERYLGIGYAPDMMAYGQTLLDHGRYAEAMAAFSSAEQNAQSTYLRRQARLRRLWLEEVLGAMDQGRNPFPSPNDQVQTYQGMLELMDPPFEETPLSK